MISAPKNIKDLIMHETDEHILTLYRTEPAAAFERLLDRYGKLIWYIARRYFRQEEDARDASQEAAVKIYHGLRSVSLSESGSLKAWVGRVTANACLDELRKLKSVPEPTADEYKSGTAHSAEAEAADHLRAAEILRAIDTLPEHHRRLIILRDLNGLSYSELAEAEEININTVKSRLSRAREALRKKLNE
jgi:RNA polymerase sigma-70 factor (ECF subfamily)